MLEHVLILDESGGKGYSRKKEGYEGELGVVAGFLFDKRDLERIKKISFLLFGDFAKEGKLHMATLSKNDKELAINKMKYFFFRMENIRWSYSARYVDGHHNFYCSGSRPWKKELLYSSLSAEFIGKFLSNGIHLAKSQGQDSFRLKCISDHIETHEINKLKKEVDLMMRFFCGDIIINEVSEDNVKKPAVEMLKNTNYSIETESTPLTFMADILSYTTWRHLKTMHDKNGDTSLQYSLNMQEHPLFEYLCLAFPDEGNIMDEMYRRRR